MSKEYMLEPVSPIDLGARWVWPGGLDSTFVTGTDTQWRLDPGYRSGPIERVSPQLPFTLEFDARGEDDWRTNPHPSAGWAAIGQADIDATAQPPLAGQKNPETPCNQTSY